MIRAMLVAAIAAVTLGLGVRAQTTAPKALPLDNLGLEHLDIIVPDPAASARFYARIFRSALHQQPVRDTLRYFVLLGDLPADRQVGYMAIGAAGGRVPAIGCVSAWRPSTRTSISGEDPTIASAPIRMKYMYGDGFTWRSAR